MIAIVTDVVACVSCVGNEVAAVIAVVASVSGGGVEDGSGFRVNEADPLPREPLPLLPFPLPPR
jgi:hypothetical protein